MASTETHIHNGGGICGTCAEPATATYENEGYSGCCNDRIEYGSEALDTVRRANCQHTFVTHERNGYNERGEQVFVDERTCSRCGEHSYS